MRYEAAIEDVQNVADTFFAFQCHAAGANKCVLYESTPAKIRDRFYAILDAALAEQLFEANHRPTYTFPVVADTYRAFETGNATALRALAPSVAGLPDRVRVRRGGRGGEQGALGGGVWWSARTGTRTREHNATASARVWDALVETPPLLAPVWGTSWVQERLTAPVAAERAAHPLLLLSSGFKPVTPPAQAKRTMLEVGGSVEVGRGGKGNRYDAVGPYGHREASTDGRGRERGGGEGQTREASAGRGTMAIYTMAKHKFQQTRARFGGAGLLTGAGERGALFNEQPVGMRGEGGKAVL
ncbi:uncharacterized protein BXZ73DRAFT_82318 [Epithele typhae]|uniref:uncharacterized protein n=1 Tax=Epithele typhae TaxID=378194 RepID=UPI002008DEAA|nr:uncharacterized protein BXZ73DRAFT_82318 [Epithele typhae]KAH9912482.1 hypothetical protein BXZ73DRAFT_82318 [Epithele typhae]